MMNNAPKLLSELQKVFSQKANPSKAEQQQSYMKSAMPYWGVSVPEVRKICNQVFGAFVPKNNKEYRETVWYLFKNAQRREEWYVGMDYAKKFKTFIVPENIDLYLDVIRLTQWWDVVDDFAVHLVGASLKNNPELVGYLCTWIKDENMWIRRTALLAQLKYKKETDSDLLGELILNVAHDKEFFIRKAIGWVLREYSYTDPNWVKSFIKKHEKSLSGLSVREGLKEIRRQAKITV